MMAESAESEPVYSLLPRIKNGKTSKGFVILFGFRKRKTGNLLFQGYRYIQFLDKFTKC